MTGFLRLLTELQGISEEANTSEALALVLCLSFGFVKNYEKNLWKCEYCKCSLRFDTARTVSLTRILSTDLQSIVIDIS